jgi:hypothetical protein
MGQFKIKVKAYMKIHEKNGWEKIFPNEIINNASNPHKNILFTNTKNIEPYDLSYEYFAHQKKKLH